MPPIAYLHGFASSPLSKKGQALGAHLHAQGVELYLPDLNRPSFAELTMTAALAAIDELDERIVGPSRESSAKTNDSSSTGADRPRWRFIGSSMGGYLAARWAELHPDRVERLLLLCPGFDLGNRWPEILNARNMARWESSGSLPFPDATGEIVQVHWGFVEDARRHPPFPVVPCRTRIVHGIHDETVPIELSRRYAAAHGDRVDLIEVDDEHALRQSVDLIAAQVDEFLLGQAER